MVRYVIVCLAVVAMAAVLGANVYNSVVDAASWMNDVPRSLQTARTYFTVVNPGTFFRIASPLAQVLALAALVAYWKVPGIRAAAATALAATVAADLLTFAYFYPRNAIILGDLQDVDAVARALREWAAMNHVRSTIVAAGLAAELVVLTRAARHSSGDR